MEKNVLCNFELSAIDKKLFDLINAFDKSDSEKSELITFAYEFIVNGRLINISKNNDSAIDKLYPVCRQLRKPKSTYLDNGLVEFA